MSKHLVRDLEHIKKQILTMGSLVEESVDKAMTSLIDRRTDLIPEVLDADHEIDAREVQIEEDCLKTLALHQPVATDLRYVIAVLKVNNDLERMGDLAVNIVERSNYLATHDQLTISSDFPEMTRAVREMVRTSLDALIDADPERAREVLAADDYVDDMNRHMILAIQELMARDPSTVIRAMHSLSISKHLERIADLATNIAEDVIFLVDGDVVRHRHHLFGD